MHLDRDIPSVDSPTTMDVDQPPPHSAHCTAAKYTGTIPLLIIEILCAYLKDVLHSSESLLGFPDPLIYTTNIHHPYRGLLDDANRHLLSTISLVHRSWTTPARDAIKTRLSLDLLKENDYAWFARSSLCGPWVRELQIYDDISFIALSPDEDAETDDAPEVDIIKHFPYLRALMLSVYEVATVLSRIIDIGSLGGYLRSLHVQATVWTTPALVQLRILVTQLPNLTTLSILGIWYVDRSVSEEDTASLRAVQHIPPPSSLKGLMIELQDDVQHRETFVPHIQWFLEARDGFALEDLRLCVRHEPKSILESVKCDTVDHLLPAMESTLPHLKLLDVRTWARTPDEECLSSTPNLLRTINSRCPALEELHVDIFRMKSTWDKLVLPKTLRRLHVFTTELNGDTSFKALNRVLTTGRLPNLREVCYSSFYVDAAGEWDPPSPLRKICRKRRIALKDYYEAEKKCTWGRGRREPMFRSNN